MTTGTKKIRTISINCIGGEKTNIIKLCHKNYKQKSWSKNMVEIAKKRDGLYNSQTSKGNENSAAYSRRRSKMCEFKSLLEEQVEQKLWSQ